MPKTDALKTYCGICGSSKISLERESLRQLCDKCHDLLQACIEDKINSEINIAKKKKASYAGLRI